MERHLRRVGSVPHFGVVLKGIRTVAEVNMYERGLEPSETDLNIQEGGLGLSSAKSFRATALALCSMCVNNLFHYFTLTVQAIQCHSFRNSLI